MNDERNFSTFPPPLIRFSEGLKGLLSQILTRKSGERITLEGIQHNAWYNQGFGSETPVKYMRIEVTKDQLTDAVSTAKMTIEMEDAPAASVKATTSSGVPS